MVSGSSLHSERIALSDDWEEAYAWFMEQKLGDGLPVVPPTEERVLRMLSGTTLDPQKVVGYLPPKWGPATVEKIAVNAVMAGCRPEYLPVVIAAVEAMAEPEFNLFGVQATTGYVGPAAIVSGALAQELNINSGAGCFGPGWRANATIGRALRLILLSIGGGIPAEMDKATFGWPGKYTFCFAENEEANPWEPLHVERGFDANDSTVTVAGANGLIPLGAGGMTGEEALQNLADQLIHGFAGGHMRLGGFGSGMPLICIAPDPASVIARGFRSKREIQQFLFEKAAVPYSQLLAPRLAGRSLEELMETSSNLTPDGMVHIADRPEDIVIVVCGGTGGHMVLIPIWTGKNSRLVTKKI